MKWNRTTISVFIFIATLVLFVPFLGLSHLFDWDEANFAEAAREMIVTGEYTYVQINFMPFWEKPPLFIWMQVLSMKAFGVNEFAARLPNAICGALTLMTLFRIGSRLKSIEFGLLWSLVYLGSILPQFYFRSGIIDPWFNLLIFSGVHQMAVATRDKVIVRKNLILSALLIGLAIMTKGPTALGLVGIVGAIYLLMNFKKHVWRIQDLITYLGIVVFVGFSWFILELARGHGYVIQEFIDYHIRLFSESEAGHAEPFYYHFIVLLVGCFPMSLFFIFGWFNQSELSDKVRHEHQWMNILFWVVLIIFSIVKTKVIHYSSLTYFPMSFMATVTIHNLLNKKWKFRVTHQLIILLFVVVLGSAFVLAGILDSIKEPLLVLIENDPLSVGNFSQKVPDGLLDPLIGITFMVASMASVFWLMAQQTKKGIIGLFGTTAITVSLLSVIIAPKIDTYTQSSLFTFYKQKGDSAYIQPLGHHSYAHLFYGRKKPPTVIHDDEVGWLLTGKVDKPVYFVLKPQSLESHLRWFPNLKETDKKGGYIILERTDNNYPF